MSKVTSVLSILAQDHQPTMLEQLSTYTPFQMLVMTLLSARTKDSTVIPLVKKLFGRYPNPEDFIRMPLENLEKLLYRVGFYRVKAKHVKELSRIIVERYHGKIPETRNELTSLPGVGRKTANCVLAYTFGKPAIAVDIHVHRISNRLGWVTTKTSEETELLLMKLVPKADWIKVNSFFVDHGQRVCLPRNPQCFSCKIVRFCKHGKLVTKK
jgi:endonuclease III